MNDLQLLLQNIAGTLLALFIVQDLLTPVHAQGFREGLVTPGMATGGRIPPFVCRQLGQGLFQKAHFGFVRIDLCSSNDERQFTIEATMLNTTYQILFAQASESGTRPIPGQAFLTLVFFLFGRIARHVGQAHASLCYRGSSGGWYLR